MSCFLNSQPSMSAIDGNKFKFQKIFAQMNLAKILQTGQRREVWGLEECHKMVGLFVTMDEIYGLFLVYTPSFGSVAGRLISVWDHQIAVRRGIQEILPCLIADFGSEIVLHSFWGFFFFHRTTRFLNRVGEIVIVQGPLFLP